jgi:hypothetical protein
LWTPSQNSGTSHAWNVSLHCDVVGCLASGGHAADDPVQFSATSQTSAAARHCVKADWNPSGGQKGLEPLQCSATSQTPADARHVVELGRKVFVGQLPLVPVQVSATSQSPALGRQVWPEERNWQLDVQHDVLAPFRPPVSQASPKPESSVPLPQRLSSVTVTQ